MGWRYLYIIIGVLCLVMSILRSFALGMTESPKWLASQGKRDEAVAAVNTISRVNKSTYAMSSFQLHTHQAGSPKHLKRVPSMVANLFQGNKQARSMICLIIIWLLVGIAYSPLSSFIMLSTKADQI